jgi:hypothetical protein
MFSTISLQHMLNFAFNKVVKPIEAVPIMVEKIMSTYCWGDFLLVMETWVILSSQKLITYMKVTFWNLYLDPKYLKPTPQHWLLKLHYINNPMLFHLERITIVNYSNFLKKNVHEVMRLLDLKWCYDSNDVTIKITSLSEFCGHKNVIWSY